MAGGRPSKYETHVKPKLDKIKEWSKAGCTNKEIATALGVGMSNFCKYMSENEELKETIVNSRISGVPEVKLALYKKAVGFEYEEMKTYMKRDNDGNEYKYTEITKKQSLPNENAIGMYLRNYDPDWQDKDKTTNEFKRMELEIKKQMAESKEW